MTRCSAAAADADEPMPGSAPRADVWVAVEHPAPWGDAVLARADHGVRILLARAPHAAIQHRRAPAEPVRAWVAYCAGEPELRVGTLAAPEEVADWDLAAIAAGSHRGWGRLDPEPLLLVCGNGRRDPCCGHLGRRMAEQLWAGPDSDRILSCTHLGGHRFAPTALLLPAGVLHGRLTAGTAAELLGAARAGRTPTATLRGNSTLDEAAQVAEARVRSLTGHVGIDPLRTEVVAGGARNCVVGVSIAPDGGAPVPVVHVDLARRERPVVASCGRQPESILRWEVVDDLRAGAGGAPTPGGAPATSDD